MPAYRDIPIYHFTDANNIPGILRSGCVYSKSSLSGDLQRTDISHYDIQQRRQRKSVGCGPGGVLHDYVPFYFATRSPMMYAISQGSVAGCRSETSRLVYLASSIEKIREADLGFIFTDGHATKAFTQMYDDFSNLGEIDWPLMREKYWRDTDEDNDRSRRRQAEFLVHDSFPWEAVEYMAVKNMDMKHRLEKYLKKEWPGKARSVESRPGWYF